MAGRAASGAERAAIRASPRSAYGNRSRQSPAKPETTHSGQIDRLDRHSAEGPRAEPNLAFICCTRQSRGQENRRGRGQFQQPLPTAIRKSLVGTMPRYGGRSARPSARREHPELHSIFLPQRCRMSVAKLFRTEVADARKDAWLGEVPIAPPLPITVVAAASILLVCTCIAYAGLGTYTRRVHASGVLLPSAGLITVASSSAGLISSAAVAEGDQVRKGALLFAIDLEATSSSGPTQQRVIEQLTRQKANLEKARDLHATAAVVEKQSFADQLENLNSQRKKLAEQIAAQDQVVLPLKDRAE